MGKAKFVLDNKNNFFTNNKLTIGTAQPTTGTYTAGDIVINKSPNSTAYGWICTASGTPGSWKILKSATDVSLTWGNITGKPSTFPPTLGTTSSTAFRGDHGQVAYNHSQAAHAPANAQRNADITKAEIEAKLTGNITTHTHNYAAVSHGTHVPSLESANNARFLRNDNTWQNITAENIGAMKSITVPSAPDKVSYLKIATFPDAGSGNVHAEIMISGFGNFGNTEHCVGIIRLSGRADRKVQLIKLVSESNYNEVRVGFTRSGTTTTVWLVRPAYCGGSNMTVLSNSGVNIISKNFESSTSQPSGWIEGSNIMVTEYPKGNVVVANNKYFMGKTSGGSEYYLMGVDTNNNINLGLNNQTYINVNNTMRVYRDIHVQQGAAVYTPGMRVNSGGNWHSINFGKANVRLEYATGDCMYIAGDEASNGGYGTVFRAKNFEAVENRMKFGSYWLTIGGAPSNPSVGDVWIHV